MLFLSIKINRDKALFFLLCMLCIIKAPDFLSLLLTLKLKFLIPAATSGIAVVISLL